MQNDVDCIASLRNRLIQEAAQRFTIYESGAIDEVRALCNSPIEQMLAMALLHSHMPLFGDLEKPVFLAGKTSSFNLTGFLEALPERYQSDLILILCQQGVGVYRADFLLFPILKAGLDIQKIVIECDGHDYHERTKEQAAHDKRRDRWMTANGYKVFRFTGSEIFKDAQGCAEEVAAYLRQLSRDISVAPDTPLALIA